MGCYDGTEIWKLVGIYIQNKFCKLMNKKDFRLYRDNGLWILGNTSRSVADIGPLYIGPFDNILIDISFVLWQFLLGSFI